MSRGEEAGFSHIANGFVPDEKTAVNVAVAILIPIYGKEAIDREKPFTATLTNETWIVYGTLAHSRFGGVAKVTLAKKDCRIINVTHGK